jgi:hypothetical protein
MKRSIMRHCSVYYTWIGLGITQEIQSLYIDGQEREEWRSVLWVEFLDRMTNEGWELIDAVALSNSFGSIGLVAYFRHS